MLSGFLSSRTDEIARFLNICRPVPCHLFPVETLLALCLFADVLLIGPPVQVSSRIVLRMGTKENGGSEKRVTWALTYLKEI